VSAHLQLINNNNNNNNNNNMNEVCGGQCRYFVAGACEYSNELSWLFHKVLGEFLD
jgi:hypothetical protein